jgi:hypothetical protein
MVHNGINSKSDPSGRMVAVVDQTSATHRHSSELDPAQWVFFYQGFLALLLGRLEWQKIQVTAGG